MQLRERLQGKTPKPPIALQCTIYEQKPLNLKEKELVNRRQAFLGAAAVAALPTRAVSAVPAGYFTYENATDAATKAILAKRLAQFHAGTPAGLSPVDAIARNMPQIIEQNLAHLDGVRLATRLASLSDAELRALAQVYTNNVYRTGRRARLYDLLATRLDGRGLGHYSRYFGFAPMYEAILRTAPEKSQVFQEYSNPLLGAPVPGAAVEGPAVRRPARFIKTQTTPNVGMTITEIYLNYRTAPVGGLGISASAYETMMYASRHLAVAYGGGYAVGTGISYLLQTYAPSLHEALGGFLYDLVNETVNIFSTGSLSSIGTMQENVSWDFSLGSYSPIFVQTGGDYGVVSEWSINSGGGCREVCPILL